MAGVLTGQMMGKNPAPLRAIAESIGTDTGNLDQRVSTATLVALGVAQEEAEGVSTKVGELL